MFVAFLAVGISSAALVLYDYYLKNQKETANVIEMDLINREQAQDIALAHGNWTPELLTNKETTLKLIHIKNDGFAFSGIFWRISSCREIFGNCFGFRLSGIIFLHVRDRIQFGDVIDLDVKQAIFGVLGAVRLKHSRMVTTESFFANTK